MININDLHIDINPKLIFMANDVENKGRSNKSFSIKIVNDAHNDTLLEGIFSSKELRTVKFEATYTVESVQLTGFLIISQLSDVMAMGVFVTGNGALWKAIENKNLRDYDYSELSHILNLANVQASETNGDYIYDVADRGAFINEIVYEEKTSRYDPGTGSVTKLASIDISERYPALKIKKLIELILNEEGYNVEWTENIYNVDLNTLYLLYMQDNAIRNSKEWEKSAIFEATGTGSYTDSGTGDAGFSIVQKLRWATENYDNGDNFTGANTDNIGDNIYTVPETGTYRFIATLNLQLVKPSLGTIDSEYVLISLKQGSTSIYYRYYLAADITWDGNTADITHVIDTLPREFEKDTAISIYVEFHGNITMAGGGSWTMYINQLSGSIFYNTVSRYYGYGSTVDFSALVPDMRVIDFFSKLFNYLNFYNFYRQELKTLQIEHGRIEQATAATIDPVLVTEPLEEVVNYEMKYNTDKAEPPDDDYFDNAGTVERTINFAFSRTLINDCVRVFGNVTPKIPVLWSDGNPSQWSEVIEPPKWKTKGNIRVLSYTGQANGSYTLTYGGSATANSSSESDYPEFEELDIVEFHRYDLELQGAGIEINSRIDIAKLYDQTYFKAPLYIEGYGRYWLQEAQQVIGDIYKLKLIK